MDTGLSDPVRGFVKSDEERIEEALREIQGWFTIHEGGEIELTPKGQVGADHKAMLYVLAAWAASRADERNQPTVSQKEIMDEIEFSEASAGVFISKMDYFLDKEYELGEGQYLSQLDANEVEFKLNPDHISDVVKYILTERSSPN